VTAATINAQAAAKATLDVTTRWEDVHLARYVCLREACMQLLCFLYPILYSEAP